MALRGSDLRRDLIDLTALASADLAALVRGSDEAALRELLPFLIEQYGLMAGSLAADWYDDLRAEVGAPGSFTARPAVVGDLGTDALIGWAFSKATDGDSILSLLDGGTQKRIANQARFTVTESSLADPGARGWQRSGVGECRDGFCDMLIARGAVYTESSVDFAAHDHCKCVGVPAFGGEPIPVKPYKPTTRNITDADRARVREWLASH